MKVSTEDKPMTLSALRRWPNYLRTVEHDPLVHSSKQKDVSSADFTWCMTAIEWGWSIEDTRPS